MGRATRLPDMLPFVPWTLRPRANAGDNAPALAWLEAVYRQESDAVYRYALALSGDAALAADVTHEAFMTLAHAPQGFDPARGSLGAYLAGIARHALLAAWRLRDRHVVLDEPEDEPADARTVADHEATLIDQQSLDALWAAIRALPWPFREALVLVDLQERPYAEAARIAGIELNTLRTRVHRARQRLAAALNAPPRSDPP
jgi:RNA polymerase sigma-70 factor (ECF subfamily)